MLQKSAANGAPLRSRGGRNMISELCLCVAPEQKGHDSLRLCRLGTNAAVAAWISNHAPSTVRTGGRTTKITSSLSVHDVNRS